MQNGGNGGNGWNGGNGGNGGRQKEWQKEWQKHCPGPLAGGQSHCHVVVITTSPPPPTATATSLSSPPLFPLHCRHRCLPPLLSPPLTNFLIVVSSSSPPSSGLDTVAPSPELLKFERADVVDGIHPLVLVRKRRWGICVGAVAIHLCLVWPWP